MIPFFDYKPYYVEHQVEIDAAIAGVLASGQLILGPEVSQFEKAFASYTGASHGIGVNSGTDALTLALRTLGIGPGDEVLVPDTTFAASANAVEMVGATPVFTEVKSG